MVQRFLVGFASLTFVALSVSSPSRRVVSLPAKQRLDPAASEIAKDNLEGRTFLASEQYLEARDAFHSAAKLAMQNGMTGKAAINLSNAGWASLVIMQFRDAERDFERAREFATSAHDPVALAKTLDNLANLHLQMGNPQAAIQIAKEGLSGATAGADPADLAKLQYQLAQALFLIGRYNDAAEWYSASIEAMEDSNDLNTAVMVLGNWGNESIRAGRLDEAERTLSEGLWLMRIHHLKDNVNVLRGLARLKSLQEDRRSATVLFQEAIDTPTGQTPRWLIFSDRGDARLEWGDLPGALADFREARRLSAVMRADIVPADQDRIALESGLNRVVAGLIDAGNRLAVKTSDQRLLHETFDAAEQDRLWSLRALVPEPNDWRTRLPDRYWDLLAQYQSVERELLAEASPDREKKAANLRVELEQVEANAGAADEDSPQRAASDIESPLKHVAQTLDAESVLFSFHLSKRSGWIWAVDKDAAGVYPIPALDQIEPDIVNFSRAASAGKKEAESAGSRLYQKLFGTVPASYLSHKNWFLEPDGPLFDMPFAALVVDEKKSGKKNEPVFLAERASLQTIPGALMLERAPAPVRGAFLGIGDAIYNAADSRYHGDKGAKQTLVLPRLPATSIELQECSRAWGAPGRILTGTDADPAEVKTALRRNPGIVHFATHVITAPGDFSSGLIALSMNRSGALGLMGPADIVAQHISTPLVVLNGCHSAQGKALPSGGLMGLTRAWIGAGAGSVLATRWDIPDDAGRAFMAEFYRNLRAHNEDGPASALRRTQIGFLETGGPLSGADIWGAYFLLGKNIATPPKN